MILEPLEKLVITQRNKRQNARVIGVKPEKDGSATYLLEPLRVDFLPFTNGARIMRITTHDIETNQVSIEKHTV